MTTVSIHEAKTHLSRLLLRVAAGEEIIIAKSGKPVAKIVALTKPLKNRVLGTDVGKGWVAVDFDAPLPKKILKEFLGGNSK